MSGSGLLSGSVSKAHQHNPDSDPETDSDPEQSHVHGRAKDSWITIMSMKQAHGVAAWIKASARHALIVLICGCSFAGALVAKTIRRIYRPPVSPDRHPPGPGVSVIIPERANALLLEETLDSVAPALTEVREPAEVIVVVNGSGPAAYGSLQLRFPSVRWIFVDRPLSFSAAVKQGLAAARFGWVYLLNNDMVLDRFALREVLRWRAPHVFAVASQIFIKDPGRRREETGWGLFRIHDGFIELFDATPEDQTTTRGALYAGGGSSLFQKCLLVRIISNRDPYCPFYWEDAEWGIEAWKRGFEVLFCPASRAWHSHRATIASFYSAEEVRRIFDRNACQFQLRNLLYLGRTGAVRRRLKVVHKETLLCLAAPGNLLDMFITKVRSALHPFDDAGIEYVRHKYYQVPPAGLADRPVILFVSPYAIFPPLHGGAIRMHQLLGSLCRRYHVILLSDEVTAYSEAAKEFFAPLAAVHLVGGRKDRRPARSTSRIERIKIHCHPILAAELRRLVAVHHPALVQIEFTELAGLIRNRNGTAPWMVTLHDVLLPDRRDLLRREDRHELELIRKFDAVIVCSREDQELVRAARTALIPNGAAVEELPYAGSHGSRMILFMGAFRYRPNLEGIQLFLEKVYPALRQKVPELQLCLLGGRDALEIAAPIGSFKMPGVTVYNPVSDVRAFIRRSAATINPIYGNRGSSIKLIESLAAGRVCVSTSEGARGFLEKRPASLIALPKVEDFREPLERLLLDEEYRLSTERAPQDFLEEHSWKNSGRKLEELYQEFIAQEDSGSA